ncbi:hypothetical protein [Frigoribacterium sp. PhB24]|uniref:hypothetical protein n=1 Tax=Frigoribacterium sp. PhB24 TaxID=2485204 RepID=UPI000FC04FCA|nr:hypothetical protein [Frigoribacterium sp. PhB24]ROS53039.1 hypothetical protein EDF50_1516 [Frigoribacterium sp. PhB24]
MTPGADQPVRTRVERDTGDVPGERPSDVRPRARLEIAVTVAVLVGAALVSWFRLPATTRGTLWAEDAALFLQQRLDLGPWTTLGTQYDGYQHLLARLLTDVAVLAPADDYALVLTALACAVVGGASALVFFFTRGVVASSASRVVLAFIPALVPLGPIEVSGNLANLHWYLLYLAPFALLWRPRTGKGSAAVAVLLGVVALSEIQAVVFAPLVLLALRHRRSWPGMFAFAGGLAVQVVTSLTNPRVRPDLPASDPVDVAVGYLTQPVLGTWAPVPDTNAALMVFHGGVPLAIAAFVPFVIALAVALATRWRARSVLVVTLALGSVLVWTLDVTLNRTDLIDFGTRGPSIVAQVGYLRYAVVPSMFLLAVLTLGCDRLIASTRAILRVPGWVVLVAVVVTQLIWFVPFNTVRSAGPEWDDGVIGAVVECEAGADEARIDAAPGGWGTTVDCDGLDDADAPLP